MVDDSVQDELDRPEHRTRAGLSESVVSLNHRINGLTRLNEISHTTIIDLETRVRDLEANIRTGGEQYRAARDETFEVIQLHQAYRTVIKDISSPRPQPSLPLPYRAHLKDES